MIPIFINDNLPHVYEISSHNHSKNNKHHGQISQQTISNSFILKICLNPIAQKLTIYLLLLGAASILLGIYGLAAFEDKDKQTLKLSKNTSEYLVGFGGTATLLGAYGFFVSVNYKPTPDILITDSTLELSNNPIIISSPV